MPENRVGREGLGAQRPPPRTGPVPYERGTPVTHALAGAGREGGGHPHAYARQGYLAQYERTWVPR